MHTLRDAFFFFRGLFAAFWTILMGKRPRKIRTPEKGLWKNGRPGTSKTEKIRESRKTPPPSNIQIYVCKFFKLL